MHASRVVWRNVKLREEPLWGMKYGRLTTINISKLNILHVKINKTYSHLVYPLLFLAISAILSLLSPSLLLLNRKGFLS